MLPRRYWQDMRRGAVLSNLVTVFAGIVVGLRGLLAYAGPASEKGAQLAIQVGTGGGVAGLDQTAQMSAALQGSPLISALAFFFFTPTGWLADYLFISGVFRGITLAVDNPWGDPVLTLIDNLIRDRRAEDCARKEARDREAAEGPEVPDRILECKKFAGKEADFVVVASRRKEGWTKETTVVADSIRLRIGDPRDVSIEGYLRTCYPLKVIRDIQVDRRVVPYQWSKDMPPLPGLDTESGVWSPVSPGPEE